MSFPETTPVVADEPALHEALAELVARHPSQRQAAAALGISGVYLSDVLNGRRPIGGMAARLGFTSLTIYIPMTGPTVSSGLAAQIIEGVRARMGKGGAA